MTRVCDQCGYAVGVKRVMLMIEGRAVKHQHLCVDCRERVLDALETQEVSR